MFIRKLKMWGVPVFIWFEGKNPEGVRRPNLEINFNFGKERSKFCLAFCRTKSLPTYSNVGYSGKQ